MRLPTAAESLGRLLIAVISLWPIWPGLSMQAAASLLRPRLIQSGFRMPLKPLWNTSGVMPPVFQANIAGAGRFPSTPVLKTGAIVNSGFMFIAVTRNLTLKIQPSTTNWNRFRKSGFGGGRTTRVTARKRVLFSRAGG